MSNNTSLRTTEIFYSLQGESSTVGYPTVFIRLTGCPLRCNYCDTEYAFSGGEWMQLDDIIEQIKAYRVKHITVTGGEPLVQKNCLPLLKQLCDLGYQVSLETSGSIDISEVDGRVAIIMDLKTPSSGEESKNLLSNIGHLMMNDEVKFVMADRADYDWAVQMMNEHEITHRCEVLFSPVQGKLSATQLADWIIEDQLDVRFQLQLHKILWGDQPGK